MEKKKLLFIIWSNSYGGGAERQLTNLINHLDPNKYDIDLIEYLHTNIKPEKVNDNIHELKPIYREDKDSKFKFEIVNKLVYKYPWILRKLHIPKKYDLQVSFNYLIPTFLLDPKTPSISWIHGVIWDIAVDKEPWLNRLQRNSFKSVNKIVAIANETKKSIATIYPEYKDKIEVINNGYDFANMDKLSTETVKWSKAKDKVEFLYCNRFDDNKNPLLLIEAVKLLKEINHNFHVTFLGKGDLEAQMVEKIKAYHLEEYIDIVGFVTNPYPYIKAADVITLTSKSEGFSTLIIEGLHFKKPYISTTGGVTDEIQSENAGLVANSPKEYMKAMKTLIEDKKQYHKLSNNGYNASQKYSLTNQVKKTEALIDSLLRDRDE